MGEGELRTEWWKNGPELGVEKGEDSEEKDWF